MAAFKKIQKLLFSALDPSTTTFVDVPLAAIAECNRHQLTISIKPDPSAGRVTVRGITAGSGLAPALFDARLPLTEHRRDRLERERPNDHEEEQEVDRTDDDPEEVDLERRGFR